MEDIYDLVKNMEMVYDSDTSFQILKDFERVLDELDLYVYKNWELGELLDGPRIERHWITCKFMWPRTDMPDPKGGKRLVDHGCQVIFAKEEVLLPRKIKDPGDYRPGTRKGKIDSHPIWTVEITMPKKLMQDVYIGKENKENNRMAELMKYSQGEVAPDSAATQTEQEPAADVQS